MQIKNPYKPRYVRFMGILNHEEWTIKVYSISVHKRVVPDELIGNARAQLSEWLLQGSDNPPLSHKVATLIIHEGNDGIYTLLNWWIYDDILHNKVYYSPHEEPGDFEFLSGKGIVACVWELAVIWHERNAWIKHVLAKNENPDIENYLKDYLEGEF